MVGRLVFASVGIVCLTSTGFAADLPSRRVPPAFVPPPAFAWTGVYIGFNAGYHYTDSRTTFTGTDTGAGGLGSVLAAGAIPNPALASTAGFIGGGQIGYNYQIKDYVLGAEVDFDGATGRKTSSTTSFSIPFVPVTSVAGQHLDDLGTVRGRFGWAGVNRLLIYGTAGFAFGRQSASFRVIAPAGAPSLDAGAAGSRNVGYAYGGGIEYAFTDNITAKAEFIHYDLGVSTQTIAYAYRGPSSSSLTGRTRIDGNIVRGGLNYRFGFSGAPIVARY